MPVQLLQRKTEVVPRRDSNRSRLPSALERQISPPVKAHDVIRANPAARRFEIGDLLFSQFTCPAHDGPLRIWSHTDHLVHVVTARSTWKTSMGLCSVGAGETVFFRKGAFVLPPHVEKDLCILIFFIPDAFVRETVRELAADLEAMTQPPDPREVVLRVNNDTALSAFFHSMLDYFASDEKPADALLKLKLKELLASILVSKANPKLSAYFRSVAMCDAPSLPAIMETNFCHNLPLEAFARMCQRSLSTFKREFSQHYGVTPARWLIARRLDCAAQMLRTTEMSVTEIAFECGFEELSHFSRAFKAKFGRPPTRSRGQDTRRGEAVELSPSK